MILRISAAFRMRTSLLLSTEHFACVATRPALLRGLACDRARRAPLPSVSDRSDAVAPDITAESLLPNAQHPIGLGQRSRPRSYTPLAARRRKIGRAHV